MNDKNNLSHTTYRCKYHIVIIPKYRRMVIYNKLRADIGAILRRKSKSTLEIFERHAEMKYKFGNRKFWARGYFVDTVGRNEKTIREYIQNQLQEDKLYDQMSMKEFIDPFTGEKVK